MPKSPYRTAPLATTAMPGGVPYIVGNEAAERFSYYGMRGILVAFMTTQLLARDGSLAVMSDDQAKTWFHAFSAANYFFPILGAIVSDALWGKYRTIMTLSVVYCLGHLALALDETRLGLSLGLALIAIGSGGIKPCVSAHVGDQFGQTNQHLLEKVFGWFYLSINVGAGISTVVTPWLLVNNGPRWAFGVPGVLMFLATVVFWAGRHKFVHVPPAGMAAVREALSGHGLRAMRKLSVLYLFVAVYFALYEQSGSAWILQAGHMDRRITLLPTAFVSPDSPMLHSGWTSWLFRQYELLPSQIQTVNPFLIMGLVPLFQYVVFPAVGKVIRLTPTRKIAAGFFLMVATFCLSALIESWIKAGGKPHINWQVLAFVILTASEVLVYQTCLEFSYTQAPKKMKSFIMAMFLLSISLGDGFTALVNYALQYDLIKRLLAGASYYWFFTLLMLASSLIFLAIAGRFHEERYIQDEAPAA